MNERPISILLAALERKTGHKPTRSGAGWTARCPAHDDRRPSLSISESADGRVLLHCFAGCRVKAVVKALGFSMSDLTPRDSTLSPPPRSQREPEATSQPQSGSFATAEAAAEWFAKKHEGVVEAIYRWTADWYRARIRLPTGKMFCEITRAKNAWRLKGPPKPHPLYRVEELPSEGVIYVVEGEKAADAGRSIGLACITSGSASSAGSADWRPLAGRRVVILPDNDKTGERYAEAVAEQLLHLSPAAEVRVARLPDLRDGEDLFEFIHVYRDDGTAEDLRAELESLADATQARVRRRAKEPELVRLADVEPQPVRWLCPGRIPLGKLTLIAGDPGLGKSFVTLDIAARVSCGAAWPSQSEVSEAVDVLLLSAEDDLADTIRPRLDAANADVSRIVMLTAVNDCGADGEMKERAFNLAADLDALDSALQQMPNCRLVIVDPVSAYLPAGRGFDSHRNSDVRAVLAPLAELAARHRVAVVAVTHLRKGEGRAIYRAMGSLAFVAAARAAFVVSRDPDDKDGRRRFFLPVKTNLSPDESGLAYHLEPKGDTAVVVWEPGAVHVDVDLALCNANRDDRGAADDTQRATPALDECKDWLMDYLSNGPRPVKEIRSAARRDGLSWRTLQDAKSALGVEAHKGGLKEGWSWELSRAADQAEERDGPPGTEQAAPFAPDCALQEKPGENAPGTEPEPSAHGEERDVSSTGGPLRSSDDDTCGAAGERGVADAEDWGVV